MYHVASDPGMGHGDFENFWDAMEEAEKIAQNHWGNVNIYRENKIVATHYPGNKTKAYISFEFLYS